MKTMEMHVLVFAVLILAFWSCYFMYDMADKETSCVNVTSSMYCPKNVLFAKGEINYFHTVAISSLSFCFMISLHVVFSVLKREELSMFMMITTTILVTLFAYSHVGIENFMFHCLGFLIGIYGANFSILFHLLYIYWQNRRMRNRSTHSEEEGVVSNTIELRNNQPGYFFDINTRYHTRNNILNFDRN